MAEYADTKLVLRNLRQVVQITDDPNVTVLRGKEQGKIKVLESTSSNDRFAVVVNNSGNISFVGNENDLPQLLLENTPGRRVVDTHGGIVMPGMVDAHTHPVFAGDRVHEWVMKLHGATYMDVGFYHGMLAMRTVVQHRNLGTRKSVLKPLEYTAMRSPSTSANGDQKSFILIHAAGGGIHFTVDQVRKANEDDLLRDFLAIARKMLSCGTTTLEAKSGYGLDANNEVKMLSVLKRAESDTPLEISPTFCGAHAVPKGSTAAAAAANVVSEQLDAVKAAVDAGKCRVENADVFCERGVFDAELSREILTACRSKLPGVRLNFHGDELSDAGGAEMGADLKAEAISHLEEASDAGIESMSQAGAVAVLLPTTAYILKLKPPPARKMIELGVPVALGSDFNPNAYCYSMPTVLHLACTLFSMTPEEALVAGTLNAAASLGRGGTHGAVTQGRVADMLLLDAPSWQHLIYRFACHDSVLRAVFKRGNLVHGRLDNASYHDFHDNARLLMP